MKITDLLGEKVLAKYKNRLDDLPNHYVYNAQADKFLARALIGETDGRKVLILADQRTRRAAGQGLLSALKDEGWRIEEIIIPDEEDGTSPRCDDLTKNALQSQLPEADIYIAAGSGVVNDLTKWLAMEMNKPYAAFATAASMNGYASANVAPAIKGVKSLFSARGPCVIAADPAIIAGAGRHLTSAGLGDVIAKPVSTADWLLNHQLFGEDYSEDIADMITDIEPAYLEQPEAIAKGEPEALGQLLKALVLSGCAMTLQGSSLPASGGEHLISHALDMKAFVDHKAHDLHGRQVGVATIFVAALYEEMMTVRAPSLNDEPLKLDTSYWGSLLEAVQPQHEKACLKIKKAAEILDSKKAWQQMTDRLTPQLRQPGQIKDCLRSAGAAQCLADIGCTKEDFYLALCNGASIRERFTSLDLGHMTGLLPGGAEEIIDTWLV